MINVPTPHNEAKSGDIAKIVIMPGDPLRAKYIADNYLTDVVMYNQVRNMFSFTGMYEGVKISVQPSGMGIPSMGIYSKELFDGYDVELIIRVGSAGTLSDNIKLRDIVVSEAVGTESVYPKILGIDDELITANEDLLALTREYIENEGLNNVNFGKTFTSVIFYNTRENLLNTKKEGYLALEMENAALYTNAKIANKKALSIMTISDNPLTGEELSAYERQTSFDEMIKIALDLVKKYTSERK